jgi:hypothetical protein
MQISVSIQLCFVDAISSPLKQLHNAKIITEVPKAKETQASTHSIKLEDSSRLLWMQTKLEDSAFKTIMDAHKA